ncbi:hypothetical protein EDC96DRAFT_441596 [Choanephora cucurbitarum]|nr:hypothetical protein EDC96DRAFT_441596 [Choanephora cucurbitarum]
MVAGDYVLLCRVQSVVPVNWRKRTQALNYILIGVRFLIGIVDVVLIKITVHPTGACNFEDQDYWGIVYTFYDTILDIYVTVSISGILIAHIRSLKADRMKVNKLLYTSVIYHNVFRSVGITITSLVSSFFLIMKNREEIIMLIWPIVDTFFVILVGYDSDLTKAIRKLRTRRRNVSSNVPSTLDLGGAPAIPIPSSSFFRPHVKPALPHRHSDSDMLHSPYSAYQHDNYFFDTDVESGTRRSDVYDFISLTGWKSKSNDEINSPRIHFANSNQISSKKVAGSIPTIIDDDDNDDNDNVRNDATVSLVVAGTTSCDTDKTRV